MSMMKHMRNLGDIDLDAPPQVDGASKLVPQAAKPAGRTTTAPSQLAVFSTEFQKISEEAERLKKAEGQPVELDLTVLVASQYQTRRLDKGKVEELVANLAVNPLGTPITVRRRADGLFEMVTGHHRVEAYRVLKREKIAAILVDLTDDEAERIVFYDNLLAPSLCDYERFLGFQARKKRHGLSDQALAEEAGVSRSLVQALMSFGRLPEGVHVILDVHRELMGSTLAADLAKLDSKYVDRVVEATRLLRDGELPQARVVQWVLQTDKQSGGPSNAPKPEPVVFRKGRQTYAKVLRREKEIVISWSDPGEAQELEEAIAQVLRNRLELLRRAELPDSGNGAGTSEGRTGKAGPAQD